MLSDNLYSSIQKAHYFAVPFFYSHIYLFIYSTNIYWEANRLCDYTGNTVGEKIDTKNEKQCAKASLNVNIIIKLNE